MNVLVTGGAGYIGSHGVLRLLADGHAVTVVDNLSRGHRGAMDVLGSLGDLHFVEGDCGDRTMIESLLRERSIEVIMHFAALAYVGESVEQPLRYYRNNTAGTVALLEATDEAGVNRFVFSSTCATYGAPSAAEIPIKELCPQQPVNPYGRSKLAAEQMIFDYARARRAAGDDFAVAALRYFNVAGSDRGGRLGEEHEPETHLVPICLQAAAGKRATVTIFGTDYPTPDGTCIRDYVHVEDLIDAHVVTMQALEAGDARVYNVGVGRGYSVREIVDACRRVAGVDFTAVEGPRRPGDPRVLYADPSKIHDELGWSAQITGLDAIIESAWRWQRSHPGGYE